MHRKYISKCSVLLLILSTVVSLLFPAAAYAGGNGHHINEDRTDTSNVLIIGDSRVVDMNSVVGKVSYNATVGGHHLLLETWLKGKWRHKPLVIAASKHKDASYYRQMVATVQNSLQKWKSCIIVIVASVNDMGFYNWADRASERMVWLGKKLSKVTVKVDGKTCKPKVYYLALVPPRGQYKTKFYGYNVLQFNRRLQALAGGTRYIGIGSINKWSGLYRDGDHFTQAGTQYYFDLAMSKVRKKSNPIIDAQITP